MEQLLHSTWQLPYYKILEIHAIILYTKFSLFSVTGEYKNLAKDTPAWGWDNSQGSVPEITDGKDDIAINTYPATATRWPFIALDLEVQRNIGYIRVFVYASKYITL